jgi:hypothetical protein
MSDFLSSQFVFLSQGWDRNPAAGWKLEWALRVRAEAF